MCILGRMIERDREVCILGRLDREREIERCVY